MQILDGKYVPRVHTGTRGQVIVGLLDEAEEIASSGYMRLHAQGREIERIRRLLLQLGVDLLRGTQEDAGWFLAVEGHVPGCPVAEGADCHCPPFRRFRSCF